MSGKKKILVFSDWFEPGNKGGGIIRSCVNFARLMKDKYEVYVFTRDRDLNDDAAYPNITSDRWIEFDKDIKIYYCSPGGQNWKNIRQQVKSIDAEFIYLNSMFSLYYSIYPLLMARNSKSTLVLAPRGMLRVSALKFKPQKKKIFFTLFSLLSLHKKVRFHATDKTEYEDTRQRFGNYVNVTLLIDAHPPMTAQDPVRIVKKPGELAAIFVGRIHPIKNLHYLLEILPKVKGALSLTIVGSDEDKEYTQQCKNICSAYPDNIRVTFTGEMSNDRLPELMQKQHIFVMPTSGENFGHAIFEALDQGRPALISDQTPWRNLESGKAGWDISLQQKDRFIQALQQAIDFNQEEYDSWSCSSRKYLKEFIDKADLRTGYYKLFS